ncbi:c-type cytochrome biogenesis protein CcmI [Ketobacter sp. MCCC 1A13808]|uniref:c-type cytochrome biogenesis protein CcmI n=1 Tax=Ketobacter sp. MCCC 1A13808 TaxID=2602738 RepID=UPI0012EB23AB|nr:c-type cytochrome biogenesis protein CcmI [Ketobacter sp. MCCC 1A13808]MVF12755.1 c-type cytochrome biogenesis protein CcmI [Ketobacter sp. MCCC 1A13808]
MTLLWVLMGAMALVGMLMIIIPVIKYQDQHELSGDVINSMVYRDRLKELDQDLQEGRILASDYEPLKKELELTLLDDVEASQPDQKLKRSGHLSLVLPLIVIVPVAAFIVYWSEGYRPEVGQWFDQQKKMERILPILMAGDYEAVEKEGVGLDDLIRALQKKIQTHPEDHRAWYMLGLSYLQLRMPQQSELAFRRALSLDPDNVDYVMGYTQSALSANGGELTTEIRQNLELLIQQQPDNPKPYMSLGMALFQSGDPKSAVGVWQAYLDRPQTDPRAAELLQKSVAMARQQSASMPEARSEHADPAAQTAVKPVINVRVDIAPEVKSQLKSSDILFIYAKAAQGPPLPLAVVRQPVADWPVAAVLSDENAMTPTMTLSKFDKVVVQARISPTGNAIPQSGDWVGPTQVLELKSGAQSASLRIENRMP